MARFEFILWLACWYLQSEVFQFQWDAGNATKSAIKHSISIDEVESVFSLKLAISLGRQVTPPVDEERLCVIGPSAEGRMISVVFTLREGKVRPISSRIASAKERRLYEEIRKTLKRV